MKKLKMKSVSKIGDKKKASKTKLFSYIFVFGIVLIFGFIVQKGVSLPQSILRPIGVMALSTILALSFFNSTVPFLLLVAYMPFSRVLVGGFDTGAVGLNLTNVFMFIVIFSLVVRNMSSRDKSPFKATLHLVISAYIIWGVITLVRSMFFYGSVYLENFIIPLKRWLTPIILYYISAHCVKDKDTLKKTVITMMIVACVVSLMAVWDYSWVNDSGNLDSSRVGGVFEQPNTLGGFFVYTMFLFLGFFFVYFPNWRYLLLFIPFLLSFRGIMVTFSRGAYMGAAAGWLAITFFRSKILFVLIMCLSLFAVMSPFILPAGVRNRMAATYSNQDKVFSLDVDEISDMSATKRLDIWKGAVEMIKDQPIFGFGYGTFPLVIGNYVPTASEKDAHNTYLIVAAETGLPSLAIFLLILFLMIKNSFWLYRKVKDRFVRAFALGLIGCLFGLIVVNMFGSRLNSEEVSAYFWIYAGLIMACVNMKRLKVIE